MFESSYTNADIIWTVRPPFFETISLVILTFSLVLLTVSRLFQHNVLPVIFSNTFNNFSFFTPISSGASIPLIFNYILVCFGFTFILISENSFSTQVALLCYAATFYLILIPFLNFIFCTIFIGLQPVFKDLIRDSRNLLLIKSFLFSVLLLLWIFNNQWSNYFKITLFAFIILFYLLRIILSLRKSLNYSIRWYYLILYFCTLEIMPYAFVLIATARFGIKIV
jgi:hypothetical protein